MDFMVPNLHSYSPYTGSCMLQHREIVRDCSLGIWDSWGGEPNVSFPKEYDSHKCFANWKLWQKRKNIVDSSYFVHPNKMFKKLKYYIFPSSKTKESYEHHPNKFQGPTEYHMNPPEFALGQHLNQWCHISHPLQLELISQACRAPLNLDWIRLHQRRAARPRDLIKYHTAWDFFETHTLPKKNSQHDVVQACFTICLSLNLLQCSKCELEIAVNPHSSGVFFLLPDQTGMKSSPEHSCSQNKATQLLRLHPTHNYQLRSAKCPVCDYMTEKLLCHLCETCS